MTVVGKSKNRLRENAPTWMNRTIVALSFGLVFMLVRHPRLERLTTDIGLQTTLTVLEGAAPSSIPTDTSTNTRARCVPEKGLRPIKTRYEIGTLLEEHRFKTGAEIGVQRGHNAREILKRWKSCETMHLIDLWAHQPNYTDLANVADKEQENRFLVTQNVLKPWESKTQYYRMYSTEAAKRFEPESLDFVYVDARHDYCGVTEDIVAYWPLLKPGGIMAGHDFHSADEVKGQDWSLCHDGTKNAGAVKGAVLDFMLPRGVTVSVAYEDGDWPSWVVQKPMC